MSDGQASDQSLTLEASQVITCILPNESIHRMLILDLRHEKGITRIESTPCRGIAALREARTKKGPGCVITYVPNHFTAIVGTSAHLLLVRCCSF